MIQEHSMTQLPEDGAHEKGLYLEGPRWDRETMRIGEPFPKILYDSLPIIWLNPGEGTKILHKGIYVCAIFETSAGRGTLSTNGQSTNCVLYIELTSDLSQKHWINQGIVALYQLVN